MDKASASPKLNVRLEEDLRCLLEAAAERSLRSLNAEIRYRLRRSLESGRRLGRPRIAGG
jgi:predicted HicB family RNase H-like nuclease